ncbi:MAG: metal-dependent transcriptional regulator [Clostridiales bacterium]|nr:metal-dependent transcriptional regulator [Clostridiales bacterium]
MKIHEAAENYLECILVLGKEKGNVRSIDVAHHMGVTKPTVSFTMKQFRENGYVEMDEDGFLTLTPMAQEIAERVYERHVVLEELLCAIGVDEENAKADACRIEHDLSDITFQKIKEYMREIKEDK